MRFTLWLVAMIAIVTVFVGCQPSKDGMPASYFSFRLGDTTYTSSSTETTLALDTAEKKMALTINGITNNFNQHMSLTLFFPDSAKAGQYNTDVFLILSDVKANKVMYYCMGTGIKINLSSINSKHAEGTFSGTLTSGEIEKPLTDGTFKVNY
ncbi:MAG: hypothetical protein JO154_20690 [Chitinophaga sp.]|uniref:hypothetical protein n=1 Tax=Chitinophaga sp. TaxID=1869181 RepID=UPI0025B90B66|nr:hypothetical protein [Chitinophaga sp.]MBV8255031.1 hypothetical protein [Chitinophaga sp.]